MKKIKVIDLLDMISKGKDLPKEIVYDNWHWYLELESYQNHIVGKELLSYIGKNNTMQDYLLTEIKICETECEKNRIEKLTRWFDDDELENARFNTDKRIVDKINEIIDVLNELKNKEND